MAALPSSSLSALALFGDAPMICKKPSHFSACGQLRLVDAADPGVAVGNGVVVIGPIDKRLAAFNADAEPAYRNRRPWGSRVGPAQVLRMRRAPTPCMQRSGRPSRRAPQIPHNLSSSTASPIGLIG